MDRTKSQIFEEILFFKAVFFKTTQKTIYFCWLDTCGWNLLVIWCFKPSQPEKTISGLKETFMKR